ncbi:VWA domain-containing protein [Acidicapsa dinghuensis]|uniref:VWA domain-containing protein n=1 Tax=Acidicapsa dinghuensis TaxID=2218256 RepID=A0ABW1ECP0_9BACT|nr:VWA domain-containing protein [Acidicapsa dinghuensis]
MSFEQVPFGESVEFAENTEPRCPCLLLLDTSGSMQGKAINELNAGIRQLRDELFADEMAQKRVEVAIVGFGPVQTLSEFQTPDIFQPPTLMASGDTPIGAAIEAGLDLLDQRKQTYRNNGVTYYRPWVFLITDGGPTDYWQAAAERVKKGEASNRFSFFAVGVEGARMDILSQITTREPLKLQELRFRDLFKWLSNSLSAVSKSQVGTQVALENPTGPNGWGSVG